MSRRSIARLSEDRLNEAGHRSAQRYTDLRLDVEHYPSRRRLLSVGGLWDRRRREYVGEATRRKVLQVHDGQLDALVWFGEWLRAYVAGDDPTTRDWAALFSGGRRGGKTDLGPKCAALLCVAVPGSWAWIVSESISKSWETHAVVTSALAPQWYVARGAPWFEYCLANGSMLWQKSGNDPDDLKQGRVDLAFLNEAQKLDERCYTNARGAIVDTGGVVIVAANPPDTAKGLWVEEMHDQIRAGRRKAKHFHFDFRQNPFVVQEALESMRDELDERTYRMQVLGEFLPRADVVFYNWSRDQHDGNERAAPEVGDFTAEFLRKHTRWPVEAVLGLDFQKHPYNAAVSLRFFRDPSEPDGLPLVWYDDQVVVEGDERDLSQALQLAGYDPRATLLVADASGRWQDNERTKGRASWELLRADGWSYIVPPDTQMKRNPEISERVKAMLAMICAVEFDEAGRMVPGQRRVFCAPELLELSRAIRSWETKGGVPYRRSEHAHLCDAASYPIWRFFPRRRKAGSFKYKRLRGFSRGTQLKDM